MAGEPVADAAVVVRDGRVAWTGPDRDLPRRRAGAELDAGGACVVPGFVDAHTHLLFAGVRREEFVARLAGTSYDGGGIRTTVAATAARDRRRAARPRRRPGPRPLSRTAPRRWRSRPATASPSTSELRLLRLVGELAGARRSGWRPPTSARTSCPPGATGTTTSTRWSRRCRRRRRPGRGGADVFCDQGVFTVDEARRILTAAREHGLGLRLHAEEIARTGAAGLAAELGCASADHLEHVSAEDARAMAAAGVVAVLLPTVTLSLRSQAWGHAAVLREAGVELALATDCNPGTSWCESMPYADPAGLPGDGPLGRRGVPRGDRWGRRTRCAGTTSATSASARTATWRCWPPSTRPTWWPTSAGAPVTAHRGRRRAAGAA